MKKGFTLIELLGVIAVLGLLAAIAIPVIDSSIKQNQEKLYNVQKEQIIKGAKDYFSDYQNLSKLPKNEKEIVALSIRDLQKEGYLEKDIKDPRNNQLIPQDTTYVVIQKIKGNLKYCYSVSKTECKEGEK